jgi:hypothetical protein
MAPNPTTQAIVTTALGVATYYAAICPCKTLLSCHMKIFYGTTLTAIAVVTYENFTIISNMIKDGPF